MSGTHGKTLPRHPYHLVDVSPWPFFTSIALFLTTTGGVMYMHSYLFGGEILAFGVFLVLYSMYVWWKDVIREATFEGHHTKVVQKGLTYGMILFIVSECMFFLAIFWGFFASSLAPTVELGAVWPPVGIVPFNPWEIPALNTGILLLSGASITWTHHAIVAGNRQQSLYGFIVTLLLAFAFTGFQAMEYNEAPFSIADGIYGSTFFMATGFHGIHVIVGTIFIAVCFVRQLNYHFTREHHFGFEAAAWYWHFVDVVWLFLFVAVYWWGAA